jgi:SAP domain-containing ribonucleoprotein
MPEYSKMKNADLEALLKSRGLPTGGKKADMVDRLSKADEEKTTSQGPDSAAPTAKSGGAEAEDEIDWDDDEDAGATSSKPADAAAPSSAATVEKAGGEGVIGNPQAVPNQVVDTDPSKTEDLSVKEPAEEKTEEKTDEKKEPPPDYTRGLAASSIDEEIEKRKKRAAKFGLKIEDDEGLKRLERAKKFGEVGPPKGLDEALPEKTRKRGRDADDQGGRGRKERRGDRFGGRRGRGGDRNGDRRRDDRNTRGEDKNRPANGGPSWMSEADRRKAEERKKKFQAPPASA